MEEIALLIMFVVLLIYSLFCSGFLPYQLLSFSNKNKINNVRKKTKNEVSE